MLQDLPLQVFLLRNGLSDEIWRKSDCDWPLLVAIGEDHQRHSTHLEESAELFAKAIQRLPRVHSVRWRVKDVEHLLAKIVRKKADGSEKYREITVENYHQVVTDLVGIRALHLFKDECIEIDAQLRALWKMIETPVVYIREGDRGELTERFAAEGFEVKSHPAGYRSVHYVIESRPLNRSVFAELQVRTIFEEAWSEIDHRVRYPNFSQSQLVAYFLAIFNRLSGSADEMGGFVRGLASTLQELESRAVRANLEKQEVLVAMEKTLGEMDAARQRDTESGEQIKRLKSEIDRLKRSSLVSLPGTSGLPSHVVSTSSSSLDANSTLGKVLDTLAASTDTDKSVKLSDFDKLTRLTSPSIDFDKLAKLTMTSIDFDALAKLKIPSIDFDALAKLKIPSIDFDALPKLQSLSINFDALTKLATPSFNLGKLTEASTSLSALGKLAVPNAQTQASERRQISEPRAQDDIRSNSRGPSDTSSSSDPNKT